VPVYPRRVELDRAVCLVTGASSGIGAGVAARLAAAGARIVVSGRDRERLAAVAAATGGVAVSADLTRSEETRRLAAAAAEPFGPVDVLVNNAGAGWAGSFADLPVAEVERLVALDLVAPVLLTRLLLPGMLERGRGHVVNIASIAGHVGAKGEALYAGAKGGLVVFSESLGQELARTPVGVSVVSPGVVDTPFFETRGAPYTRRRPRPVSVDVVADAVVRAVERDRPVVIVPGWLSVPARLHGALPGLYRLLATRFG
jgi:short-subunit dehydrogenase